MKYLLAIAWVVAGSCVFVGADPAPSPNLWQVSHGDRRSIPIEKRLPGPPLILANQDPETVQCEHALRLLWFKKMEVKDASLETTLAALAKAVEVNFPKERKLRFVMQTGEREAEIRGMQLTLALSTTPLTEALGYVRRLANVEFVVDHDTVFVKAKPTSVFPPPRAVSTLTAPAPQ
jgi:hypothetical protein